LSLFGIADLHLSLGSDKPMDIFGGWDNYVEKLEKNWRNLVKNDDTVVIAGDISWAMKIEHTLNDFSFINSLPGKKIFIKGNHDYWWLTKKKIEDFLKLNNLKSISILKNSAIPVGKFCVCGTRGWFFTPKEKNDLKILNREAQRLEFSIDLALKTDLEPIVFLHYPPIYDSNICHRIVKILEEKNIKKCYYGHIHEKKAHKRAFQGVYKNIKFNLISCDYTDFSPVLIN